MRFNPEFSVGTEEAYEKQPGQSIEESDMPV
jgi:hypothetical protein